MMKNKKISVGTRVKVIGDIDYIETGGRIVADYIQENNRIGTVKGTDNFGFFVQMDKLVKCGFSGGDKFGIPERYCFYHSPEIFRPISEKKLKELRKKEDKIKKLSKAIEKIEAEQCSIEEELFNFYKKDMDGYQLEKKTK